ncbi:hypothetical protein P3X46_013102 [Hevea brasiliensis]|uniref:Cytochrome P450 n=1 Tax=Hevea brasiliensis TaxID=3981 RepID=A0ABQ9M4A6_HEVBR|nr:premnaspirodiene oxygenase [Hevea brasiliensis]KAJ9174463.1 hypothetical protein P3X46_013102 [Hevea brasiliensis]
MQFLSVPLLSIFFLLHFILWSIWKKLKTSRGNTLNLPPGPQKLPIIGNMHQFIGYLPHRRLRDLAKKYGPIMHLQFGQVSTIVISSPETAKEIMKTHDVIFAQRPFVLVAEFIFYNRGDILFAPYGDYWRQIRKICTLELLSSKRVQLFRSIREEEVSNLVKSISSSAGSPVNLSKMLFSSSCSVIARAAFGKKCKDQETFIPLAKEALKMMGGFSVAELFPSIKLLRVITGIQYRLEKLHKRLDMVLENIINQHRIYRATAKTNGDQGEAEVEDIVNTLLNLQEHGNLEFPLTTNNIKAIILDVFIAGTDTSAAVVEWAMSELIKNPRAMSKAQAEVRQVLNRKRNVEEAGLEELKYLKAVIKETLRIHPPGPLLAPRENKEQCQINGYNIPIKTKVIVNAWAIGRDPDYWIHAEKFYPERFLESKIDFRGSNFEFLPFGAGRRICPGLSFGIANLELPLAQLLYHFDWELPDNSKKEELDMREAFGAMVRRKFDLFVIPIPYNP